MEKYQDLPRELQKIWNTRVQVIPLVAGSIGAIPQKFRKDKNMLDQSNNKTVSENSCISCGYFILR